MRVCAFTLLLVLTLSAQTPRVTLTGYAEMPDRKLPFAIARGVTKERWLTGRPNTARDRTEFIHLRLPRPLC